MREPKWNDVGHFAAILLLSQGLSCCLVPLTRWMLDRYSRSVEPKFGLNIWSVGLIGNNGREKDSMTNVTNVIKFSNLRWHTACPMLRGTPSGWGWAASSARRPHSGHCWKPLPHPLEGRLQFILYLFMWRLCWFTITRASVQKAEKPRYYKFSKHC